MDLELEIADHCEVQAGGLDLLGNQSMKRKPETLNFWIGRLPHWEVVDGRYFVTIHLAGAIPAEGQRRIRDTAGELEQLAPQNKDGRLRIQRKIFREMERWLDHADYSAHLHNRHVAEQVIEAIRFRVQQHVWQVFEWVLMPNHLHLFFELTNGCLKQVLEAFKKWTARKASEIVAIETALFWQREWFDHWSRSDSEDDRIVTYVRQNPVKAGLVNDHREWPYGSWATR
jgi:putative transposase